MNAIEAIQRRARWLILRVRHLSYEKHSWKLCLPALIIIYKRCRGGHYPGVQISIWLLHLQHSLPTITGVSTCGEDIYSHIVMGHYSYNINVENNIDKSKNISPAEDARLRINDCTRSLAVPDSDWTISVLISDITTPGMSQVWKYPQPPWFKRDPIAWSQYPARKIGNFHNKRPGIPQQYHHYLENVIAPDQKFCLQELP